MSSTTEAACLLNSGTMYHFRLGLRGASGGDIFAGVKPGAVSIFFDDAPIFHFDLDGRWQRAFVDGMHYLKGLDATARSIGREREAGGMVLRRSTLPYAAAADLDASIRSVALSLIDDLDAGRLEIRPGPTGAGVFAPEDFREFLERASAWDSAAWFAHRERYLGTYGPISFLPPDCPHPLILQATLGDVDGRAFGGSPAAEHYVRSPAEFADHVRAVGQLVGRRVSQHRSVFLGGADALRLPMADLLAHLAAIGRAFPVAEGGPGAAWDDFTPGLGDVHAFLDDFAPSLPDLDGWRALRGANLGHVTLGVESGDPAIRSIYGKTWADDDLRAVVADLKAAGIGVGLVLLVGAGGPVMADRHLGASVELLGSLPMEAGDLVTLIDARSFGPESPGGLDPMDDGATAGQVAAIKARLAAARPSKGPKVVAYNPDKRWA